MMVLDLLMIFIGVLILIIGLLVGSFLVLMERKILGYIQVRKGPNKLGIVGILQSFSDAIKLFTKEIIYLNYSNYMVYYFSPIFFFILSLFIWIIIPYYFNLISFNLGVLFVLSCLSLGVYMVLISGWSSNSNYSLLGGLRALAQTISYEVSLVLILMSVIVMIMDLNIFYFKYYQSNIWFIMMMYPLSLCWLGSMLAETNRTPFDFSEGESELVSGFNVEYSGGGFALIFLSEYASILFMSFLLTMMFIGLNMMNIFFWIIYILLIMMILWLRGTMPRFRYDFLMYLCWMIILPFVLNFMMYLIII
uniref:NADH dehydrogenase subunit 1 n=1 Tax=Leucoma salicis TaxID=688415 RepID=UPI002008EEC0|nr:NADH dehydrogenase subunit 1 [Leucoma salicis]UOX27470.1 NADH dehydrogenase subunit 1 [Leucoma salicis]